MILPNDLSNKCADTYAFNGLMFLTLLNGWKPYIIYKHHGMFLDMEMYIYHI